MDPLAGTPWSAPSTVDGFAKGTPNRVLLEYAGRLTRRSGAIALDIGCGAARNSGPLAAQGWQVIGVDLSRPMVEAARDRMRQADDLRASFLLAPMEALPIRSRSIDLIVAHGIWNLARTDDQFRRAIREAARVARIDAALFVFTFSRHTLPEDAAPVPGEALTYTQFSGQPQIFLTESQLLDELAAAGFERDDTLPLTEYNRPTAPTLRGGGGGPVIYEAAFRYRPAAR
ncbi:MAG: class I SAM-dependent methyltransferase [Vicinamibacterales bacterium]